METATRLGDGRTHALVDCVPVSGKEFAKAPIFFKKVSTLTLKLTLHPTLTLLQGPLSIDLSGTPNICLGNPKARRAARVCASCHCVHCVLRPASLGSNVLSSPPLLGRRLSTQV